MNSISSDFSLSKERQKEKLKLILVHDKTDLSKETFELLQNDILQVINKYIEVNFDNLIKKSVDIGEYSIFVANIPK